MYKGKVGLSWISVIVILHLVVLYAAIQSFPSIFALILLGTIVLFSDVFIISFAIRNFVLIDNDILSIYFGFFKTHIRVKEIQLISETSNPIAGSALSLDRLLIRANNQEYIISVKNKRDLIEQLQKLNKDIKVSLKN